MVLSSLGFDVSEADLRHLCDCTPFGTDALKAVGAARQLGFAGTSKHNLSPTELEGLLRDGHHPIVFVDLMPIDGVREQTLWLSSRWIRTSSLCLIRLGENASCRDENFFAAGRGNAISS